MKEVINCLGTGDRWISACAISVSSLTPCNLVDVHQSLLIERCNFSFNIKRRMSYAVNLLSISHPTHYAKGKGTI